MLFQFTEEHFTGAYSLNDIHGLNTTGTLEFLGGRQFVKTVTRQNCNSSKRIRQKEFVKTVIRQIF